MRAAGAIAACVLTLGFAGAAHADVMGIWQVPGNAFQIRIAPCGAFLCGVLLDSNRLRAEPEARDEKNKNPSMGSRLLRGITMFHGFKGGPTSWAGGSINLPVDSNPYNPRITLT